MGHVVGLFSDFVILTLFLQDGNSVPLRTCARPSDFSRFQTKLYGKITLNGAKVYIN